jgi:hypothetical protein
VRVSIRQLVTQIVGMAVVFGIVLFGGAGTLAWPAGWVYMVLMFGFTAAISAWLVRHDPALLNERLSGVPAGTAGGQKAWDRVFLAATGVVFLAWLFLMPLDAVRFEWSHLPA